MGFGQIFVGGALAHAQIGNGVQAQAIDAEFEPKPHDLDDRFHHRRIVVVQIRLVGEKAVPVVLLRHRVPAPVGGLGVGENDPGFRKFLVVVVPDVERPFAGTGRRAARGLKPGVLFGGMVDHQFGDDLEAPRVRLAHKSLKIAQRAVIGVDVLIVADVVAVIAQRRGVKRHQPQRVHAQLLQVVQPPDQPPKIAHAVLAAVAEGFDVQLVDDGVLVPQGVFDTGPTLALAAHGDLLSQNGGWRGPPWRARASGWRSQQRPTPDRPRRMRVRAGAIPASLRPDLQNDCRLRNAQSFQAAQFAQCLLRTQAVEIEFRQGGDRRMGGFAKQR